MQNAPKSKAVFLDRDGVLNKERGAYTYLPEEFEVLPGVAEALQLLKGRGYVLIVVTNQGGIAKGIYEGHHVLACHEKLQQVCNWLIDAHYFAPGHPEFSETLSRKPDSLMLEKALAKFNIDPARSWLIGDKKRDLEAAAKVGVKGILVGEEEKYPHNFREIDLLAAARFIIDQESER